MNVHWTFISIIYNVCIHIKLQTQFPCFVFVSADLINGNNMSNGSLSNDSSSAPCQIKAPLVVTISGLPCRGKSLAAHKISRNLFWKGEDVKGMFHF